MTKVYFRIPPPPHFGKLQIWDDQILLRNTAPISENFRFGMTKVYSGIPPPPENCQRVQFQDFLKTEIYYIWRLYPTRITTSYCGTRLRVMKTTNLATFAPLFQTVLPSTAFAQFTCLLVYQIFGYSRLQEVSI